MSGAATFLKNTPKTKKISEYACDAFMVGTVTMAMAAFKVKAFYNSLTQDLWDEQSNLDWKKGWNTQY